MTTDIKDLMQKADEAVSKLNSAFEPGHIGPREVDALSYAVDVMRELEEALGAKDARIAELQSRAEAAEQHAAELMSSLRPVGVMSQAAYYRLENSESRFIALWPRPEIHLPRKRPDDGVIVYARTSSGIQIQGGE